MTKPFLFAEKIKLAHHHRPDDAVLAAATTKLGRRLQIGSEDFVVVFIGRRQQTEHAFQMVKARHRVTPSTGHPVSRSPAWVCSIPRSAGTLYRECGGWPQ